MIVVLPLQKTGVKYGIAVIGLSSIVVAKLGANAAWSPSDCRALMYAVIAHAALGGEGCGCQGGVSSSRPYSQCWGALM